MTQYYDVSRQEIKQYQEYEITRTPCPSLYLTPTDLLHEKFTAKIRELTTSNLLFT